MPTKDRTIPKSDGPPWFDRIGIDKTCRLVGMCRGMITLTRTDDGTHTLWIYDQPVANGDAVTMRNRYADHLAADPKSAWLEWLYRK
jgi:hypothetical protein